MGEKIRSQDEMYGRVHGVIITADHRPGLDNIMNESIQRSQDQTYNDPTIEHSDVNEHGHTRVRMTRSYILHYIIALNLKEILLTNLSDKICFFRLPLNTNSVRISIYFKTKHLSTKMLQSFIAIGLIITRNLSS